MTRDFATPVNPRNSDYAFSVEQLNGRELQRSPLVMLVIGGVDVPDVLIDSGATCNVMGQQTWELLKQKGIKCESRKSARELFAYGGTEPLPTLGTFTADVTRAGMENGSKADFVVVKGDGRTLLGRETAEVLSLLRIGPLQANCVASGQMNGDIREKYKHLFSGVGLLKGYELKLHVDESVKPVVQHVRRIPFGLHEKVDAKLDELLELDIIEEVPEGPSRWISPLVVVPKSDGDVRVCVNMRRANEAIIRERHPIPTVEELLHDLNGSTVFKVAHFKVGCRTRIVADASPVGLGAVLTQQQGGVWRVVSYASRSLTDVERRYSQTEKEALALVWACERFNMYVSGQSCELETDHKPLERIYSRTSKPCARIERWVLRLQGYYFKVVYRPGKTNVADALSRLNSLNQVDHGEEYDLVRAVVESCVPAALSLNEIEEASDYDEELTIVKSCVRSGSWDQCTLPSYAQVKDEP